VRQPVPRMGMGINLPLSRYPPAQEEAIDVVGVDQSQAGVDRVQARVDRSQAGVDRVQVGADQAQAGVNRAQVEVGQAQAGVIRAQASQLTGVAGARHQSSLLKASRRKLRDEAPENVEEEILKMTDLESLGHYSPYKELVHLPFLPVRPYAQDNLKSLTGNLFEETVAQHFNYVRKNVSVPQIEAEVRQCSHRVKNICRRMNITKAAACALPARDVIQTMRSYHLSDQERLALLNSIIEMHMRTSLGNKCKDRNSLNERLEKVHSRLRKETSYLNALLVERNRIHKKYV